MDQIDQKMPDIMLLKKISKIMGRIFQTLIDR